MRLKKRFGCSYRIGAKIIKQESDDLQEQLLKVNKESTVLTEQLIISTHVEDLLLEAAGGAVALLQAKTIRLSYLLYITGIKIKNFAVVYEEVYFIENEL